MTPASLLASARPGEGRQVSLWPHQVDAVDAAVAGLRGGGRGQVVMACGSGKTLVALRVVEHLMPAGVAVVLAPTLALVAQTLAAWRRDALVPFEALVVCSDDTTADAPVHVTDLAGTARVTTDPAVIGGWLTGPARRRVVIGTYASSRHLGAALHDVGATAQVLVCDEAHHLAGQVEQLGAQVLHDATLPARRRLFLTATPRADASGTREGVVSMDDEEVFGPTLYRYSFARAISEGHLKDYRLVVVGIADSQARRLLDDLDAVYVDPAGRGVDLRAAVAQAALAKAVALYGLRRVLTFHPRVADAAQFSRTLAYTIDRLPDTDRPAGPVTARLVHGEMTTAVRRGVLDELTHPPEGGWVSVANVRVLGEGVDVPAIDAVAFTHAKRSSVDIVQAVGRALRCHPDSPQVATIIVPIVVPDSDGELADVNPREYETLWRVVRALRAHDETLGLELDLQRSHDHTENPSLPCRFTVVLPHGTSQKILADLSVLLVRNSTSQWWEGYGHARTYATEHGDLLVPAAYRTPDGFPLGHWIAQRRHARDKGWLSADRIEMLDQLGMVWDHYELAWQTKCAAVRAFHAQHGHIRITGSVDRSLAHWLSIQRVRRSRGELSAERIAALDALGMEWDASELAWRTGLAEARAYHAEHGDLDVRKGHLTPSGHRLGDWLNSRRLERRKGLLSADRIAALDALGIEWDPHQTRWQTGWQTGLDAATRYAAEHGNLRVPHKYRTPDGFRLGSWLLHQRQLRNGVKKGGITADRIAALDALGMIWGNSRRTRSEQRDVSD